MLSLHLGIWSQEQRYGPLHKDKDMQIKYLTVVNQS